MIPSSFAEADSNIHAFEEDIALHIENICAKIIDFDHYFIYEEILETKFEDKNVNIIDFSEEIQAMIRIEKEEIAIIEKLNDDNIDLCFSDFFKLIGCNFDKIKDLVMVIFTHANRNPKKIDSITKLLAKFLSHDSDMKFLFWKALIELCTKFDSGLVGHKVILNNLSQKSNSGFDKNIFLPKINSRYMISEQKRSF